MEKQGKVSATAHKRKDSGHAVTLFNVFGIEVRLDISVLIIFTLIVYSLGNGVYSSWHPEWSPALIWGTALFSGVAFFASLLAHELSHSVVSQHFGIPVPRITLFLFGGMAEISKEPTRPKHELLIALAGPLMSLLIAVVCNALAGRLAGDIDLASFFETGDISVIASLGALATSLLWLGSINLILAIFNMIPGFPMDGGRVFRAIIWAITGDQLKATRWASNGGRFFGWFLMMFGVLGLFQGYGLGSLWSILIGWFIASLATMSYRQLVMDRALGGHKVADLMRTRFETVDAKVPLKEFIDNHLLRSNQRLWPVMENNNLLGTVSLSQLSQITPTDREHLDLRKVIIPVESLNTLAPDTMARDAIKLLMESADEPVLVLKNNTVQGLVQHEDIVKWLTLHEVLA
jgi:Zn-dependent protease